MGVLKDGVMGLEGGPLQGVGIVELETIAVGGGPDAIDAGAGEERGEDQLGEDAGGDGVGEESGLLGDLVEGWELKARVATLVDLLVGELVEDDPQDAWGGRDWRCEGSLGLEWR